MTPVLHTPSTLALNERSKYESIWEFEEYRKHSPGLENVERFFSVMKPAENACVIDVGCGDGRAGLALEERGLRSWWVDITAEALHPDVDRSRFYETPLWESSWSQGLMSWDYAFCVDVMEHVPPEFTMLVVDRITSCCDLAWFQISTQPDVMGGLIGQPLHLQVQTFSWWLERLSLVTKVWDARDLCQSGLFVVGRGEWEI